MNYVYAVVCNPSSNSILRSKLFSTKERARIELDSVFDSLKGQPGVELLRRDGDAFSYLFGWEERQINYYITSIEVE
jgi:hypothetical protein